MIPTCGGRRLAVLLLFLMCGACGEVWNDPNPRADQGRRVLHESFNSRPKHLDPAQSYTEDEGWIVSSVYESLYEYHYLKRPYTLQPALAAAMPQIRYRDANGNPLPADASAEQIAETVYEIPIRRGLRFQPHPALARDRNGALLYADFDASGMGVRDQIGDFANTGTREVDSADFAYQFKRLARPGIHVPVFPVYRRIVGMDALAQRLRDDAAAGKIDPQGWVDMREYPLEGVETPDPYTLRIRISGKFPQFIYWLAISFVTPVPWEAERFYALPGMAAQEFSLDMWPVGTGAFMMTRNRPLREMVLARNPEYRENTYPCEGEPGDAEAGLLDACGERLPLVDEVRFSYEREATPFWNKFLQGYYDFYASSRFATMDGFDSALQLQGGDLSLTPRMSANGIGLRTELEPSLEFFFLNMLDPVLGNTGATAEARERARKLRRAINIAVDVEEYIGIILNGLGLPIQGPLPRGMAGVREGADGINPYIYTWANGRPKRRDLDEARRLLAEAGYPRGRDAVTGKPLLIYFDGYDSFTRARLELLIKQLARIDIQLVPRLTEWNRFQEKIRRGNWQMSFWGWNADYPDPETFLFQYYGPNSKVRAHGENYTNFSDPEFDRLYEQFQFMDLDADRQPLIDSMVEILRRESPLAGGWQREAFVLNHGWLGNTKPGKIARVYRKYYSVDPQLRAERQLEWNRPRVGVLIGLGLLLVALGVLAVRHYRRHERERGLAAGRPA